MSIPKVSVIVPIYNAEKTLARCLNSLVAQTYENLEFLLVDDGSTDGSKSICEDYCARCRFFRLISKENGGPSSARNTGIDQSSGKYIYFVDSDDYIEPETIAIMVKAAEEHSADMVISAYYIEKADSSVEIHQYAGGSKLYVGDEYKNLCNLQINDMSKNRIPPYSWVRLILRSALNESKMRYSTNIIRGEDFHFFVRLQYRLKNAYVLAEPLYHYVEVPTSITHRYVPGYWGSVKFIYQDLCRLLPKTEEIQKRLDLMLLHRTKIALNNSTYLENKDNFETEIRQIMRDELVGETIRHISLREGQKKLGFFHVMMKLKLYPAVSLYYSMRRARNKKARG